MQKNYGIEDKTIAENLIVTIGNMGYPNANDVSKVILKTERGCAVIQKSF